MLGGECRVTEEIMPGTRVSVRELKSRLSHYLRLAKAGQTVEITERGKPIGRIVPLTQALEDRLDAMARLGFLSRGEGELPPRQPVDRLDDRRSVAELLLEERD